MKDMDGVSADRLFRSALNWLRSLPEDQLRTEIIGPLFGRKNYARIHDVHNRGEGRHKLDFLLESAHAVDGVQVKVRGYATPAAITNDVMPFAREALRIRHVLANGEARRLNKLFWITSGEIAPEAGRAYLAFSEEDRDSIEIWSGDKLADVLLATAPQLIPELELLHLERQASELQESGLFVASWRTHSEIFSRQWARGDLHGCGEALRRAQRALEAEPAGDRFFVRVFLQLTNCRDAVLAARRSSGESWNLESPEALRAVPAPWVQFWTDVSCIERQLHLLAAHHLTPTNRLTFLRIATLVLRAGFTPRSQQMTELFDWLNAAFDSEQGRSIDGQCTLCTGAAISCLGLANQERPAAADWLWSLRSERFISLQQSFVGAGPREHAMHYTSSVLGAFTDEQKRSDEHIAAAAATFFPPALDQPIVSGWLRHRKEAPPAVFAEIFPNLLRHWIRSNGSIAAFDRPLGEAASSLAGELWDATHDIPERGMYFDVLENIPGLVLACALAKDSNARSLLSSAMEALHRRARLALADHRRDAQVLDSRLDRSATILDGWLLYWEAALSGTGVDVVTSPGQMGE